MPRTNKGPLYGSLCQLGDPVRYMLHGAPIKKIKHFFVKQHVHGAP